MAGAWTQPAGEGLIIVSVDYSEADSGFGPDGQGVPARDFRKTELRSYVEYGLTDWATAIVQPEWRDKETGPGQGERVRGLGRVDAGLRVRLWNGEGGVVSVQGAARMPGAADSLAPADGGDTEWEADGRLLYGRGFVLRGYNAFTDVQLGYRKRFGGPADEVRLDLTGGVTLTPTVLALFQSFNTLSIGTPDAPLTTTREHKVAASLVYHLTDDWSVQAGGIVTVAGENVLAQRGVSLGLWRSF